MTERHPDCTCAGVEPGFTRPDCPVHMPSAIAIRMFFPRRGGPVQIECDTCKGWYSGPVEVHHQSAQHRRTIA